MKKTPLKSQQTPSKLQKTPQQQQKTPQKQLKTPNKENGRRQDTPKPQPPQKTPKSKGSVEDQEEAITIFKTPKKERMQQKENNTNKKERTQEMQKTPKTPKLVKVKEENEQNQDNIQNGASHHKEVQKEQVKVEHEQDEAEEGEEEKEQEEVKEEEDEEQKEQEVKIEQKGEENKRKVFKLVKPSFQALGVSDWLVKQLTTMGIKNPSQIQHQSIPIIKSGRNVIGIAHTGSGKTAAFAIPILDKLSEDPFAMFALVLSPTRELALQIADQFRAFGAPIHLKVAVIVGGENLLQQNVELDKHPHIVISTPGRLMGIIESNPTFNFKHMKFLVIDEADTMLHLNYSVQLQAIMDFLPPPEKRQTLLFSATMSRSIRELSAISVDKPEVIRVSKQFDTSPTLRQEYMFMPMKAKHTYLVYLLRKFRNSSIIVFVPSIQVAAETQLMLERLKVSSSAIHSLLSQEDRKAAISNFRDHKFNVLVATNLASRGLDIPNVDLVINFDIPERTFDYIHRVGRTARGGKRGKAISLVSQFESNLLQDIESRLEMRFMEHQAREADVMKHLTDSIQALKYAETKLANSRFSERLAKVQQNSKESKDLVMESLAHLEDVEGNDEEAERADEMGYTWDGKFGENRVYKKRRMHSEEIVE